MVTKTKATSAETARRRVDELAAAERGWYDRQLATRAKIVDLEVSAGAGLLNASDVDAAMKEQAAAMASLRAEVDACEAAIVEARRQRIEAIPFVRRAEAEALREQAAPIIDEINQRQAHTDRLLAELKEHEGCEYTPFVPTVGGLKLADGGGFMPDESYSYPVPRTRTLQREATQLEERAAKIESRKVHRSGSVTGRTVEQLQSMVLADTLVIGPMLSAIDTWVAEETAKLLAWRKRHNQPHEVGYVPLEAPVEYTLTWLNEVIDRPRSMAGTAPPDFRIVHVAGLTNPTDARGNKLPDETRCTNCRGREFKQSAAGELRCADQRCDTPKVRPAKASAN